MNLFEYGLGDHREEGIGSQEFWVSTGVDFGLSVVTGIIAATGVAIVAAGAAVVVGTAVAAPALVIGAAIAGLGLSLYAEHKDIPDRVKAEANAFVDAREAEVLMLEEAPTQCVAPKAPPTPLRNCQ